MAACSDILTKYFPSIDSELTDYIVGVLDSSAEDIQSSEDVYDAVGEMLLELSEEGTGEDSVRDICLEMIKALNINNDSKVSERQKLNAPVHLKSMAEDFNQQSEESMSIWMAKKEFNTVVDAKKLEKAEAKSKAKLEKRAEKEEKTDDCQIGMATASQATNRREAKLDASGMNRSYDIHVENLDVAFGDKVLLQNADLHLAEGRRYGLVGRNGIGKTTLLKMLSSGELRIPSHLSVLHVEQEVVGDDTTAVDSVLESDLVRSSLLQEERELTAMLNSTSPSTLDGRGSARLGEIYAKLEEIEADKAPARAAQILNGLGFTPKMQEMTTKEFSGGWRMRLALARALFMKPDLLLLDEPTNMLDIKAILWLENYLQTWSKTILVVSHDRLFLDSVATDIIHFHSRRLDYYRGNFEMFLKTKTEKLKNQQKEYESQKQYRDHIQVFIDRFRYNANRASQVQSKLKLLEKLPKLTPIEKEPDVILKFPDDIDKLSPPILRLDEVDFYYSPAQPIFKKVDISADLDSRIAIVGENGTGKTTLLKILIGELDPVNGIRHVHRNLRIGYFSQHHVDQLEMNVTSVELLASRFPGRKVEEYRHQLGCYGVSGELAMRPVASLSGGQKSRVAFANMAMVRPNFFILDEPTNHLDMETIEALGKALKKFKGGVILVSHDERLIRIVCNELWVCGNGTVRSVEGGFDEYKKILEAEFLQQ
ncbi:ATP-binding cassette sub-family F member 3-like [Branchiostoma floridae x Branchiostoma belcheri]